MREVIGLMSGTSLDGVDAAAIRTDGVTIAGLGPAATRPFAPELRARLRRALDRAPGLATDDPDILALGRELADLYAEAVLGLGVRFDLVGMHGQTVLHRPAERRTWQIGDAQRLADRLGCEVVHDFRAADVAAGGQGAPLMPLFHAALLPPSDRPAAVLNIGGVANLTWVGADPSGSGAPAIVAADTGPGNALLDDFVRLRTGADRDEGGALGLAGRADPAILARLLADPFFGRPAPKSLDRLDFHAALEAVRPLSDADGAATLAEFTAAAAGRLPLPAAPARLLVCGGGRHNRAIMRALARQFGVPVEPVEALGWDGDALEAQGFGYLAMRSVRALPLSLPGTTGVPAPCTGGRLARPGAGGPKAGALPRTPPEDGRPLDT